jgi:hypothetical protein
MLRLYHTYSARNTWKLLDTGVVSEPLARLLASLMIAETTRGRLLLANALERPRIGIASSIYSALDMQNYLIDLHPRWTDDLRRIQHLHRLPLGSRELRKVYYVDTEFAHTTMVEIAIVDRFGNTVLHAIIDYGLTHQGMRDRVLPHVSGYCAQMARATLRKYYGPDAPSTPKMTPEMVYQALMKLGFPNVWLVEWSSGRCDYHLMRKMLEPIGRGAVLPPKERSLLFVHVCKGILFPGLFTYKLPFLYPYVFPGSALASISHYADADARKLFDIADLCFSL